MAEHTGMLRSMVEDCFSKHLYETALYFSNKLVSMSGEIDDYYMLAQTYYLTGQYQRAYHTLEHHCPNTASTTSHRVAEQQLGNQLNLIHVSKKCRLLAAKCKAKQSDWGRCLEILQMVPSEVKPKEDKPKAPSSSSESSTASLAVGVGSAPLGSAAGGVPVGGKYEISIDAAIYLLQGQAYEALENRKQATHSYKKALKEDIFCYEAFQTLIDKQMLSFNDEMSLFEGLDFKGHNWLKQLYQYKLKKYNIPSPSPSSASSPLDRQQQQQADTNLIKEYNLDKNTDIITARAESYFFQNQFEKAYALTKQVLDDDPFNHSNIVVVHLSCLVELGKKSDLFYIAHKLVEMQPSLAVSWYAVGCYYYLIGKYERARRYFSKSTTCTRDFGPGWLGFGHAFAVEGEHDQALAAYRSAHRLLSRSHIPPLCIGIELVRANNLPLARQFVTKSKAACPYDPLVYNELGVIDFKDGKYIDAITNFEKAMSLLNDASALTSWEPIFFNLGHCYRKLRKYKMAIKYYKKALKLCQNSTTYTALAFTQHLMNNTTVAIELYHRALALNAEDTFASGMLLKALQDEAKLGYQSLLGPDPLDSAMNVDAEDNADPDSEFEWKEDLFQPFPGKGKKD